MLSAGVLIWISCRPLIRLVLCVASGFVLTKTDNFPAVAARGAGQVMLNIALPCLMFSKIVPAFTSDNIRNLGPLVLVAVLYEAIGVAIAWVVKQLFWVPHRFRYGILVAGGWGNVGDIPTSVMMSLTGAPPFNGAADQNLSVAYISAFVLVFMMTLFPLGGSRWVAMDYVGPDIEPEEVQEAMRKRRTVLVSPRLWPAALSRLSRRRRRSQRKSSMAAEDDVERKADDSCDEKDSAHVSVEDVQLALSSSRGKRVAFNESEDGRRDRDRDHDDGILSPTVVSPALTEVTGAPSCVTSPDPTVIWSRPSSSHHRQAYTDEGEGVVQDRALRDEPPASESDEPKKHAETAVIATSNDSSSSPPTNAPKSVARRLVAACFPKLHELLKSLLTPASLAIVLSFPIALIPPLKALFVPMPESALSPSVRAHIRPAPDGQPPLAFFIDTTAFIGAASVPLGLICLGSALARLEWPRNRSEMGRLPLGAIGALAVGKMVVSPVLGVLIVQALVRAGLVDREDKVLRFVCIFLSCLPTATTQVFLTQVYSGTGSAEHLSAFLIPQYILMFVSMTALIAFTLQLLF